MRNKFAILIENMENMESMAAVITVRLPPMWLLLPVRIHILPSLQQCLPGKDQSMAVPTSKLCNKIIRPAYKSVMEELE